MLNMTPNTDKTSVQVSSYIARSWDENRPLWSVAYIPNYRDGSNGRSAMVSRGHHTQTDGQGFILSQLYVTSYGQDLQKMMDEGGNAVPLFRQRDDLLTIFP